MQKTNNTPQVDQEFDVTIESIGQKGDGVAKRNGFIIFVPETKRGETVRVRITKVLEKFAFGEIVSEEEY